jgi:Na+-transporting methylmalonyl-CoA/oxaloacetate decarboxylase gamma subunit
METPLSQGLLITLVGMGLVFLALILLWLLIDVMVRLFTTKHHPTTSETPEITSPSPSLPSEESENLGRRRRAAAAAVAIALGLQSHRITPIKPPSSAPTPWQMADRLNRFTPIDDARVRKLRGAAR